MAALSLKDLYAMPVALLEQGKYVQSAVQSCAIAWSFIPGMPLRTVYEAL